MITKEPPLEISVQVGLPEINRPDKFILKWGIIYIEENQIPKSATIHRRRFGADLIYFCWLKDRLLTQGMLLTNRPEWPSRHEEDEIAKKLSHDLQYQYSELRYKEVTILPIERHSN